MKIRCANIFKVLSLLLTMLTVVEPLSGQPVYYDTVVNGSFELFRNPNNPGILGDWGACSLRDNDNTPDLQPGSYGVTLDPYHGKYYAGLITKPPYFIGTDTFQIEYISQRINPPTSITEEFFFVMYLATSYSYRPNGHQPEGRLKIRRGDGHCMTSIDSILWESPDVVDNSWSLHVANVTMTSNIGWFHFQAANTDNHPNQCNILLDSLSGPFVGKWPKPDLGSDFYLCSGDTTSLSLPDPQTTSLPDSVVYAWSDGFLGHQREITLPGEYIVCSVWKGLRQCDTINILEEVRPEIGVPDDSLACLGQPVVLTSKIDDPSYEHVWSDGTLGREKSITSNGFYSVQASNGICTIINETNVLFKDCEAFIDMPNVFTPNGDGINDTFGPMRFKNVEAYQLKIYDRWGRLMSDINNIVSSWNGVDQHGRIAPTGVYYWVIQYTSMESDEVRVAKGNVSLFR